MTRLGVITASQAEAEALRALHNGSAPLTVTSGGDVARARAGAEALCARGVSALVSFGAASGLAPVLRPGDVVIAESVVLPSGTAIGTDEAWRAALVERLLALGIELRVARIASFDELLVSPSAKRRAFQRTFAAALDTESHAIAEVAQAAQLPFLSVRAIADPAEQPGTVRGTPALVRAVRLAVRPWDLAASWRAGQNGKLALAALRRIAGLGPEPFAFRPT